MKPNCLTFFFLLISFSHSSAQNICNILDFGASRDSTVINTQAIQKAIDQCSLKGGGTVIIPSGVYYTGTLFLKSNVGLSLEPSAVLKGSPEMADYKNKALIYALEQENISITGRGKLDGNGGHKNFQSEEKHNGLPDRPKTIKFEGCRQIKLNGFTLQNGACHCISLIKCTSTTVDDICIISRIVANNDGIDIIDCHHTKILNSYFDCGDDAICPKSDNSIGVKNLVVSNCIIKSESNGIKFGTNSAGGFQDVAISNCVIRDTRLAGLALEVVDGGIMDRIVISNITMHNVDGAIFIKIGQRKGDKPGILRNVMISNIIADGIGLWEPEIKNSYFKKDNDPRIGVSIVGQPGFDIQNITLSNIYLQFAGGGTLQDAERIMEDAPEKYPEFINFGITPAYGINCRHGKNIVLDNIQLEWINRDDRPAMFFEDVKKLSLRAPNLMVSQKAKSFIRMKDVSGAYIHGCKPDEDIPFLSLEGDIRDISIVNNDFHKLKKIVIAEASVNGKEVFEK